MTAVHRDRMSTEGACHSENSTRQQSVHCLAVTSPSVSASPFTVCKAARFHCTTALSGTATARKTSQLSRLVCSQNAQSFRELLPAKQRSVLQNNPQMGLNFITRGLELTAAIVRRLILCLTWAMRPAGSSPTPSNAASSASSSRRVVFPPACPSGPRASAKGARSPATSVRIPQHMLPK